MILDERFAELRDHLSDRLEIMKEALTQYKMSESRTVTLRGEIEGLRSVIRQIDKMILNNKDAK